MKILREPLVQFLLIGAALFGIFAAVGRTTAEIPNKIVVPAGMIENLKVSFERGSGRPPTAKELDAVIDDYVREEILCREAIARGLDRDDPIVRRELRKKMEFLTEDDAGATTATEAQRKATLDAAYAKLRERYVVEIQRAGGAK